MAWENIEERLKKGLTVEIAFPTGKVWLPDFELNVDQWLTSIAQTDEELKELDLPRIRFLHNRWPIQTLFQAEWDSPMDRHSIFAMDVGKDAYILFSDGSEYYVIAAISPKDRPELYQAVVSKLLQNKRFFPEHPRRVKNYRPDLLPEHEAVFNEKIPDVPWSYVLSPGEPRHRGYLSEVLVGWVGRWIDLPELGFWHEEIPESIKVEDGKYVVNYDKQKKAV
jgi:hypothetical protein